MAEQDPRIYSATGRQFSASVVGVVALIVDERERFLMLSHPDRPGSWEAISGALKQREALVEAVLREVREEAGTAVQVQPLGVVHAYTVPFDEAVTHLASVCFLLRYRGGEIVPGDDMAGSTVGWLSPAELADASIIVPWNVPWIFDRALEVRGFASAQARIGSAVDRARQRAAAGRSRRSGASACAAAAMAPSVVPRSVVLTCRMVRPHA